MNTTDTNFAALTARYGNDPQIFALHRDGQARNLAIYLGRNWDVMTSTERDAYREAVDHAITANPAENTMPNGYATAATMTGRKATPVPRTTRPVRKGTGPDPRGEWASRKVFV